MALIFLFVALSILAFTPGGAAADQANYPFLQPVNTSGPRATLRSFLVNADKAQKEFQRAGYRSKDAIKHMGRAASHA